MLPQHDMDLVNSAVFEERYTRQTIFNSDRHPVTDSSYHCAGLTLGVPHPNVITGFPIRQPITQLKLRPAVRDTRFEQQPIPIHPFKAKYRFQGYPIHPTRRAGIPAPATLPYVRVSPIDIGSNNIGL